MLSLIHHVNDDPMTTRSYDYSLVWGLLRLTPINKNSICVKTTMVYGDLSARPLELYDWSATPVHILYIPLSLAHSYYTMTTYTVTH